MLHGLIMAGGSGTRFWPLSRRALPKHLLPLAGSRTLLQQTWDRCLPLIPPDRFWVVTHTDQQDETRRQLPELSSDHLIAEPCGRNTAPCIGLAAKAILAQDPDATLAVLSSDHAIAPPHALRDALAQAAGLVDVDPSRLIVFGVPPTFPATGYGYIERGASLDDATESPIESATTSSRDFPVHHVAAFKEKPDAATAARFLEDGQHLWNSGLFVWQASTILDELRRHEPALTAALDRIGNVFDGAGGMARLHEEYPGIPSISIDYAVLERAKNVCVIETPFAWDDLGSWEALARHQPVTADGGNVVTGSHCGLDTHRSIIRSTDNHLIATVGVDDLIIVHTPDATLVARRGDETAMRRLIEQLARDGLDRYL